MPVDPVVATRQSGATDDPARNQGTGSRCFCVFEGGGAKGIAHVGALAALQQSGLELVGFAGTSAGAMIAALAAVGYRADELLTAERSILDEIDLDATNIWSGPAHKPAREAHRLFGRTGWWAIRVARHFRLLPVVVAVVLALLLPPICAWLDLIGRGTAAALEVVVLLVLFLACLWLASGLASLSHLERALNQALRLALARSFKLDQNHRGRDPAPITFGDLAAAGCPPLKVVAADICSRKLVLFSPETTPDNSVASAVAASICLPVIFHPWRIGSTLYFDGGLVSNLPAWAFDAERALDRDAWTAVIQVGEEHSGGVAPAGLRILSSAVLTGIFGSSLLNTRNVDRLKSIRLEVRLGLLKFDPGLKRAAAVAEDARKQCLRRLIYQLRDVPLLLDAVCERICTRARRIIDRQLRTEGRPAFTGVLRGAIYVPTKDDSSSLSADFSFGYRNHPDERLRLPRLHSAPGEAVDEQIILYVEKRDPEWTDYLPGPRNRWSRKLIWSAKVWTLCVPYLDEHSEQEIAFELDSDTYLDLDGETLEVTMLEIADIIEGTLFEFLPEEAFKDGSAPHQEEVAR